MHIKLDCKWGGPQSVADIDLMLLRYKSDIRFNEFHSRQQRWETKWFVYLDAARVSCACYAATHSLCFSSVDDGGIN